MGAFVISPLPPLASEEYEQQGPFAPRALPRLDATAGPSATLSPPADFPGCPVIRPGLLRRFHERGEEGFPSCSACPRHRAVATTPPERIASSATCDDPCCLRLTTEGSASGAYILSGAPVRSLALRPGDSLTIPRMASSMGFRTFGFPPACHSSYGALATTPVGLTPTEHASLRWAHCRRCESCRRAGSASSSGRTAARESWRRRPSSRRGSSAIAPPLPEPGGVPGDGVGYGRNIFP